MALYHISDMRDGVVSTFQPFGGFDRLPLISLTRKHARSRLSVFTPHEVKRWSKKRKKENDLAS